MPVVKAEKLSTFIPQVRNANRHTARGLALLNDAMALDGYVAPMTATADGEVIDGSARLEKAAERYPDEALVIPHDGTRPIVMVRTDIPNADDPRAKRIAVAANRIAQVNLDFDPAQLAMLSKEIDLAPLWTPEELNVAIGTVPDFQPASMEEQGRLDQKKPVTCPECGCTFVNEK